MWDDLFHAKKGKLMSMVGVYRRLSVEEFENIHNDPVAADRYFGFDFGDEGEDEALDKYMEGLETDERYLDIGKAWNGLHFLLTGTSDYDAPKAPASLRNVVFGGKETEWEMSYGAVRYLSPEEVIAASAALKALSDDELKSRFDAKAFEKVDIYPVGTWDSNDIDWLLNSFRNVKDFFDKAAVSGEVILLSIE